MDDGIPNKDDGANAQSSMFDRKSHSIFSSSISSGFGSRAVYQLPDKSLGWNTSFSQVSSSLAGEKADAPIAATCEEDDDLGFNWERSNEATAEISTNTEKQSMSGSAASCKNDNKRRHVRAKAASSKIIARPTKGATQMVKLLKPKKDGDTTKTILYIQMQLCSVQTLADFLSNRQLQGGYFSQNESYAIDILYALRLFGQIANGVKYVHSRGLIHRDLKPQNCFIDDAGNVKVGDFGLSRELSTTGGSITSFDRIDQHDEIEEDCFAPPDSSNAENTAGVGTRAYASPEQMRGSQYDASTDLYSLGIIFFELCYPMKTSMERYQAFSGIRKGNFPSYWNLHVKTTFPTLHKLLVQMISNSAAERPSADVVSDCIDSLLREYSVQSLDKSWEKEGAVLLRVEAEEKEGILACVMKHIKDAVPHAKILQYGLRGQTSNAITETCSIPNLTIMEFAIVIEGDEQTKSVETIFSRLREHKMTVRQISHNQ